MPLTERQQERFESNAENGLFADSVGEPQRQTLRQLSMQASRAGTVRQTVGAGARALFVSDGMHIDDMDAAEETAQNHIQSSASVPRHSTYAAARFDDQMRPTDTLVMPNRVFGSHQRPETESQGASAERGDHRGHGVSQAQTMFAPGVHRALMTSQSSEMNTAVQLPWERQVNVLIASGRRVFWEVHNEFTAPTQPGLLPRATHQHYVIASTDSGGQDLRVHVNARVSQR